MKDLFNFLITSSADPQRTSLALRGILVLGAGKILSVVTALCGLGLLCLGITNDLLQQGIDIVTQFSMGGLYILGAIWAAYGMYRKANMGRWTAYGKAR